MIYNELRSSFVNLVGSVQLMESEIHYFFILSQY